MKIKYESIALRTKAIRIIEQANTIIEEYEANGFDLTLRQLYYQFVARGLFENIVKNYRMLGEVMSSGRRAGLVSWNAIVDRTRFIRTPSFWDSPDSLIQSCASQFQLDLWADQVNYVEIWFEKDALLGVFERAADVKRIPYFSCRGYVSDSEAWSAAQRLARMERRGKRVTVLHFGDHDPSGIDMTRDIDDRLHLFGAKPIIKRMALNMDQVRKYSPPPNPAKETDSRFADYQSKFGDESWELDALSPDVVAKLVDSQLAKLIDIKKWNASVQREKVAKDELALISRYYDEAIGCVTELKKQDAESDSQDRAD